MAACSPLLHHKQQSHVLDLSGRFIVDDNILSIMAHVEEQSSRTSITTLDLSNNWIHDEGCIALGQLLRVNNSLNYLYLDDNKISDVGFQSIADGLGQNSSLIHLSLSYNRILGSNGSCKRLSEILEINKSLKVLVLAGNSICDEGVQMIARGLKCNASLTQLILWNNKIGDTGCKALSNVLKVNQVLESLWLSDNENITYEGAWLLADGLRYNTSVKCLSLECNSSKSTDKFIKAKQQIDFFCALNRAGRNFVFEKNSNNNKLLTHDEWINNVIEISKEAWDPSEQLSFLYHCVRSGPEQLISATVNCETGRQPQTIVCGRNNAKRQKIRHDS